MVSGAGFKIGASRTLFCVPLLKQLASADCLHLLLLPQLTYLPCISQGRKLFRLFSPTDAKHMHTVGTISRVHANGRINYHGEPSTAADGRTADDVAAEAVHVARSAQRLAERRLHQAEEQQEDSGGSSAAAWAVQRAEEALDEAMDGLMAAEGAERKRRRQKQQPSGKGSGSGGSGGDDKPDETTPPNFSRLGALEIGADGKLPAALGGARLAECELKAGEMLYLPAGWFHEVLSSGSHCALNFWYHPPDRRDFEQVRIASPPCLTSRRPQPPDTSDVHGQRFW